MTTVPQPVVAAPYPMHGADVATLPETHAANDSHHLRTLTSGSVHSQGLGPDGLPILDAEAQEVDYGEKADQYEEFSGILRGYSAVKDRFFWLNYRASPIDDTLPRMIICAHLPLSSVGLTGYSYSLGCHCLYCCFCRQV